jgi:hypothetical protein
MPIVVPMLAIEIGNECADIADPDHIGSSGSKISMRSMCLHDMRMYSRFKF